VTKNINNFGARIVSDDSMEGYNIEVKNVGSGVLFIVIKDDKRIYEHLVTVDMLKKAEIENE